MQDQQLCFMVLMMVSMTSVSKQHPLFSQSNSKPLQGWGRELRAAICPPKMSHTFSMGLRLGECAGYFTCTNIVFSSQGIAMPVELCEAEHYQLVVERYHQLQLHINKQRGSGCHLYISEQ